VRTRRRRAERPYQAAVRTSGVAKRDALLEDGLTQPVEDPGAAREPQPAAAAGERRNRTWRRLERDGVVMESQKRLDALERPGRAFAPGVRGDASSRPDELDADRPRRRARRLREA
jgi:hypothetical protein